MTLLRQIMICVVLIFLVLFSANFVLTVLESRHYLEQQMQVHAQDTATSLGLSMTTATAAGDQANLEVLANAVFDRGYYQEITLTDLDGKLLLARRNPLNIDGVPAWFTDLVTLPMPAGTAEIMSGWTALGTLRVVSHPGHAYRDLWRISSDFLYLFAFIVILSYAVIGLVLKVVLRPLAAVEQQAADICERHFAVQEQVPRTRELRKVVLAMNRMSSKLKTMFERQVRLSESLREEARTDPVTGLVNRREFDAVVDGILRSESGPGSSTLMLLQVRDFADINLEIGRPEADALLRQVADGLREALDHLERVVIARRGGAEFAVFVQNTSLERARVYLQTTFQTIATIGFFTEEEHPDALHMSAAFFEKADELSMMLTEADAALRNAQSQGTSGTHFLIHGDGSDPISDLIKQSTEWRATLKTVIADKNFLFHYQPVLQLSDQQVIAHEIFVRLELDGEIVNAGVFIPMAERHGMLQQLDQLIIQRAFEQLSIDSPNFVINLSTRSVQDEDFLVWLTGMFVQYRHLANKIIIELQEYSVHLSYERVRQIIETSRRFGYRFSIDHFGSGGTAFSYLQSLEVDFIKIDRSFVTGIEANTDNQFFIQSVAQIAHARDMVLVAEGVETQAELTTLTNLGVDAAMGYLLGRPGPHF